MIVVLRTTIIYLNKRQAYFCAYAVTVQAVKGHDYTTALREAIKRGSAWILPTAEGFRLEIQDPDLLGRPAREVVLTLETGDVVVAPILSRQ